VIESIEAAVQSMRIRICALIEIRQSMGSLIVPRRSDDEGSPARQRGE
jgi:hypothetical protein